MVHWDSHVQITPWNAGRYSLLLSYSKLFSFIRRVDLLFDTVTTWDGTLVMGKECPFVLGMWCHNTGCYGAACLHASMISGARDDSQLDTTTKKRGRRFLDNYFKENYELWLRIKKAYKGEWKIAT